MSLGCQDRTALSGSCVPLLTLGLDPVRPLTKTAPTVTGQPGSSWSSMDGSLSAPSPSAVSAASRAE
eukprot:6183834-Lingulodinium_polyedra.AAC.1